MTGPSLLGAAVDELYSSPLAEFTARRKTLAAAAKKAGDRVAATAIGGLRKPTLSADTVNRLVRGAPAEVDELLQLGTDLREAEKALDAGELRRLGDRRRRLVHDLAELAFDLTGQSTPSPAVRDEVTATLNAALADDEVAQRLSSGALVTQARWDGFGSTQLPELAASLPDLPAPRRKPQPKPETTVAAAPVAPDTSTARDTTSPVTGQRETTGRSTAGTQAASPTQGERAAVKRTAMDRAAAKEAAARQAAADQAAENAAAAAARTAEGQELVSTIDRRISELNLQLAHQRRLLADAQRALRTAESQQRAAAQAATRAGAASR